MQKLADISLFESLGATGNSQQSVFNREYPNFDNLGKLDALVSHIGMGKRQRNARKSRKYKKQIDKTKAQWEKQGSKSKKHDVPYEPELLKSVRLLDEEYEKGTITKDQYNQILVEMVDKDGFYHPEFYGGKYDDLPLRYRAITPTKIKHSLDFPSMIDIIDPDTGEIDEEAIDLLYRLATVNTIIPSSYPLNEKERMVLDDWLQKNKPEQDRGMEMEWTDKKTGKVAGTQFFPRYNGVFDGLPF